MKCHSRPRHSPAARAGGRRRHRADPHRAGRGLSPHGIESMIRGWLQSLQVRLALRVAALYIVATVVVIVVLMSRAYDTPRSLGDQELLLRANDLPPSATPRTY